MTFNSVLCLLLYLHLLSLGSCICVDEETDKPVAYKDGDFIIAGLFNIGRIRNKTAVINGRSVLLDYCDHVYKEYNTQKALVMRDTILSEMERFEKLTHKTLGYEIYDICESYELTSRVSMKIANNPKTIGLCAPDLPSVTERSLAISTSTYIPTFTYMYSDNDHLSRLVYPTVYSMIDTEATEAKITMSFLRKMDYMYMDIWYHIFSKDMAEYISDNYIAKQERACKRLTEVTFVADFDRINDKYNQTKGTSAPVQLILQNTGYRTEKMLKYFITELGFTNKIYIFGISNGRKAYHQRYINVLKTYSNITSNNTFVFPISLLLNTDLPDLDKKMSGNWSESSERLDEIYKDIQKNRCLKDNQTTGEKYIKCNTSSWFGYVVAGVKVLIQSLIDILTEDTPVTCVYDLRDNLFKSITDSDKTKSIKIDEEITIDVKFLDKTFSRGYSMDVYDSRTDLTTMIGNAYPDRFEVTNEAVFNNIKYPTRCSVNCTAGKEKRYTNVKVLPCCWECLECQDNFYAGSAHEDRCEACTPEKMAKTNHSDCVKVPVVYVEKNSVMFIGGAVLSVLGFIVVIATGIFLYWNDQRPVIKASDHMFIYLILVGLLIGMLINVYIPLVKPSNGTCHAEYFCSTLMASILTSNLAWRCGNIYLVFAAANGFSKPKFSFLLSGRGQAMLNLGSIVINVGTAIVTSCFGAWSFNTFQVSPHNPLYLVCSSDPSFIGILKWLPFVIPGLLFLFTLVMAFKMRNFSHNFKETVTIFAATSIVALAGLMFLCGYSMSPPAPEIQQILRSSMIFVTSLIFLVCLFGPKVIIVMKGIDVQD